MNQQQRTTGRGGHAGRGHGNSRGFKFEKTNSTPQEAVPTLSFGPNTNWLEFKKRMSISIGDKYGMLNTIIEEGKYYDYPAATRDTSITDQTLQDELYKDALKNRQKTIEKAIQQRPNVYNYIRSKLSVESEDELKRHKDYDVTHKAQDPLELWKALEEIHLTTTVSKKGVVVLQAAQANYMKLVQGDFQTITKFKEEFDGALLAYNRALLTAKQVEEVENMSAMNFLTKLNRAVYGQYYATKINAINADETKAPKTVNEVYVEAKSWVHVTQVPSKSGGGASFATTNGDGIMKFNRKKESPKNPNPSDNNDNGKKHSGQKSTSGTSDTKTDDTTTNPSDTAVQTDSGTKNGSENKTKDLSKVQCYGCGLFGHYQRNCSAGSATGGLNGMTRRNDRDDGLPKWYEVGLDSCSQVNVLNSRFLKNIRQGTGSFIGIMDQGRSTSLVGDLEGFFECQVCDDCAASVLCEADVEDMYPITYVQGVSKTVHTPNGDIVFYRRVKMYLADFRPWITDQAMTLMTTKDREALFNKSTVERAKLAGEFVRSAGFPSESAAIDLVRAGNVTNIPFEVKDVRNYFEIYGQPVESLRGKQTKFPIQEKDNFDSGVKMQVTVQTMTVDVMEAGGKKFLISLSEPLQVIVNVPVTNLTIAKLGEALQKHLDLLRMFGFSVQVVYTDPLKALLALRGSFPGVEITATGAGDHLPKIDIRIRRVKEMCRSLIAGLDWVMPKILVTELITFCICRLNTQRTSSLLGNESPRVRLTGRRVDYKREYALTFGDYCEVRKPNVILNNITHERTEPAIALYPTLNMNGSWKFLSLRTRKIISRSVYKKMKHTPEEIIDKMTALSITGVVTTEDFDDGNFTGVSEDDGAEPELELHEPDPAVIDNIEIDDDEIEVIPVDDEELSRESESDEDAEIKVEPRRSQRSTAGKTTKFGDYELANKELSGLTRGYGMALMNLSIKVALEKYGKEAYDSVKDELLQLFVKKKALTPVLFSQLNMTTEEIIRSHMFLKAKIDANGIFEKIKARLVADGSGQDRSEFNEEELASPTASLESIFNIIKIIVEEGRHKLILDVGGAYLNAAIDRDIYMWLDPAVVRILISIAPNEYAKYKDAKGRMLVKVTKAMYGLVQSAKLWYERLTLLLKENGFIPNVMDPCVWNKTVDRVQTTIVVYVDDLLISSKRKEDVLLIRDLLEKEFLEVKIKEGNDVTYLGMNLKTRKDGSIELSMLQYIKDILDMWPNQDLYLYGHPADDNLFYGDDNLLKLEEEGSKRFHKVVAQLLYLCKRARPDIGLPVHYLCTKVKSPSKEDESKLERVLGYLKSTIHMPRIIQKDGKINNIEAYIDAAFAAHQDGMGQSGGAVMMGSTLLEPITRKQKCAAKDSTEAELVALSELYLDVLWHQEWFENQGYKLQKPTIFQDNTSTITLVTVGGGKMRNKHMRAKQAVVLEGYKREDYDIKYIRTEDMLADVNTKAITGYKYHRFTRWLMGRIHNAAGVR